MDGERTMLLFAIFGCFLIFLIAYTVGAMPATRARILTASPLILQQLGTWPGLETVVMGTGGEGGGFMTAGRGRTLIWTKSASAKTPRPAFNDGLETPASHPPQVTFNRDHRVSFKGRTPPPHLNFILKAENTGAIHGIRVLTAKCFLLFCIEGPNANCFNTESIMRLFALIAASLSSLFLATSSAQATSSFTYVSATGTDAGTCTPAAPCKTINYALGQTSTYGEVHALNAAQYGPARITRSVKLIGVPGATMASLLGSVVNISAGAGRVEISGFTIDPSFESGSFATGISSASPNVFIKNCLIRNTKSDGIYISSQTGGHSTIEDTTINAAGYGIVLSSLAYPLDVAINRVSIIDSRSVGLLVSEKSLARVANTYIAMSGSDGILLNSINSFLTLQSSQSIANGGCGVNVRSGLAYSAGNNSLITNGKPPVCGTMTVLGLR
jgi:hypothetical protein